MGEINKMSEKIALIFDTETSGFMKKGLDAFDTEQAWSVQLAWILASKNKVYHQFESLIRTSPDKEINYHAEKIHGISKIETDLFGINEDLICSFFKESLTRCDLLVAHNLDFDFNFLNNTIIRSADIELMTMLDQSDKFCTMRSSTELCAIPKTRGAGYKWPKLVELHQKLFDCEYSQTHTALDDVQLTAKCFFKLDFM